MPAKGVGLKVGKRHNIIDKKLWKEFKEVTGKDISYFEFLDIIYLSNELISNRIADNISGFKFPERLGYCAVTRYKPKQGKRFIDWKKSKEFGTRVYHTNMHSHGYQPRIIWLTNRVSSCKFANIYKFTADRRFSRRVSANTKLGKIYNEFVYEHFKMRKMSVKKLGTIR